MVLRDRIASESVETVNIPVTAMRPFHPVHLEVTTNRGGEEFDPRCLIYFSLVIEEAISSTKTFVDELVDIAIMKVNWSPDPISITRLMIGMTTHGFQLQGLPLQQVDLIEETNIARELNRHKSQRHSIFLSPVLPVNPSNLDNEYGAQCIFTVPKSYINNQISFYLFVKDEKHTERQRHSLPNVVVAYTEILDEDLKSSLQ